MIILQALLIVIVAVIAPLLWLMYFSNLSLSNHHKKMERLNINHAQDMQKLHGMTAHLFPGDDRNFVVTYLVPTKQQPLWSRLVGRVRLYPFTFNYSSKRDDTRTSQYTKTISKSKWFYMQLKNWSETGDREAAVKAMKYLRWTKEIP